MNSTQYNKIREAELIFEQVITNVLQECGWLRVQDSPTKPWYWVSDKGPRRTASDIHEAFIQESRGLVV